MTVARIRKMKTRRTDALALQRQGAHERARRVASTIVTLGKSPRRAKVRIARAFIALGTNPEETRRMSAAKCFCLACACGACNCAGGGKWTDRMAGVRRINNVSNSRVVDWAASLPKG